MIVAAAILAGGLGAVARYVVTGVVQTRVESTFPWGTAVVNVTGALLLGMLTGALRAGLVPLDVGVVLGGGFLGSYTTFSTWMVETVRLAESGGRSGFRSGATNVAGPLVAGLAGAVLGYVVGGWL